MQYNGVTVLKCTYDLLVSMIAVGTDFTDLFNLLTTSIPVTSQNNFNKESNTLTIDTNYGRLITRHLL